MNPQQQVIGRKAILIAGGSGLIGTALSKVLESEGHEVRCLTSNRRLAAAKDQIFYWDIRKRLVDDRAFSGVNVIYNLAGESIAASRWSKKRKHEILESRVVGTQLLSKKIADLGVKLDLYVGASAVGFYGNGRDGRARTEEDPRGEGFLAETCEAWEKAHEGFRLSAERLIVARFGNVLSREGGFIGPLKKVARFGFGPLMGGTDLKMPWIHVSDVVRFLVSCLSPRQSGIFNLVAASEGALMLQAALYKSLGARLMFRVPAPLIRIAMGEMAALVLEGCNVSGARMHHVSGKPEFPDLDSALPGLTGKKAMQS